MSSVWTVQSNWGCSEISFPQTAYYFNGKSAPAGCEQIALARQISDDADLLDKDFKFAPMFDRMSAANYLDKHADKIPEPFIHILIEDAIHTEWGAEPKESPALLPLPSAYGRRKQSRAIGWFWWNLVIEGGNGRIIDSLAQLYRGRFS